MTRTREQREQLFADNLRLCHKAVGMKRNSLAQCPGLTADDFLQVARLGLWEATAYYKPEKGAFSTIAMRTMLHRLEGLREKAGHAKRNERATVSLDMPVRVRDNLVPLGELIPGDDDFASLAALQIDLRRAFDRLPDRSRRMVRLDLAGYKDREIGAAFGVSRGPVQAALSDALCVLAEAVRMG